MIDDLQRQFASLADSSVSSDGVLESVHRRVAVRRGRRRRAAVVGTVGAVAAVAIGAVLITTRAPVVSAAAGPTSASTQPSTTFLPGDPGILCKTGGFRPAPTPLVAVEPISSTTLALAVVPRGWVVTSSDPTSIGYGDPAAPPSTDAIPPGGILLSVSSNSGADTAYNTTINGHDATVQTTDACAAAGYQGYWLVNMRYGTGIEVQLQGPTSLHLSEAQIREMAASIVARQLTPGHG